MNGSGRKRWSRWGASARRQSIRLIAACAAQDITVRRRAVLSLGHLSAPDEKAKQAVLKCASDAAPQVRAAAVKSLSECGLADDIVLPVVKENLRHGDEEVRLAVVNLLVQRRTLLRRMAPDLQSLLIGQGRRLGAVCRVPARQVRAGGGPAFARSPS